MLRKGVYQQEYIDNWEKFNDKCIPEEEDFYSHLNMEDISKENYTHAKRVCQDFKRWILSFVCSQRYIIVS